MKEKTEKEEGSGCLEKYDEFRMNYRNGGTKFVEVYFFEDGEKNRKNCRIYKKNYRGTPTTEEWEEIEERLEFSNEEEEENKGDIFGRTDPETSYTEPFK